MAAIPVRRNKFDVSSQLEPIRRPIRPLPGAATADRQRRAGPRAQTILGSATLSGSHEVSALHCFPDSRLAPRSAPASRMSVSAWAEFSIRPLPFHAADSPPCSLWINWGNHRMAYAAARHGIPLQAIPDSALTQPATAMERRCVPRGTGGLGASGAILSQLFLQAVP